MDSLSVCEGGGGRECTKYCVCIARTTILGYIHGHRGENLATRESQGSMTRLITRRMQLQATT